MKIEIIHSKVGFDKHHNPALTVPHEMIRETVTEQQLVDRRRYDLQTVCLLLTIEKFGDYEQAYGLICRLIELEGAICVLSSHMYVIVHGLLADRPEGETYDYGLWEDRAEQLYALNVDEVHAVAMRESVISAHLHSLSGRMIERLLFTQMMARHEETQELGCIGSWHYVLDTGQIWWSEQVYQIFARDLNEGAPKFSEFVASVNVDDRPGFREVVDRCMEDGAPFKYEHRIHDGKGRNRTVFSWGKPVFNEFGKVIELTGVVQDITERRLAENDLRHHEAALSFITEGAPAMLYALRMDCENVLWVDYYSLGSIRNFGRRVPVKGERLEPFIQLHYSQELYDEILRQCLESARELTPWSREFRMEDDFGELRWISGRSMPARLDDGCIIWRGVLDDVSEQKRLEEQLQMADRLSSIGTLAAGIAHEINNPLSFVMSNLEYTLEEIPRYVDCQEDNEIELALLSGLDGARRISVIVKGLMTYARQNDDLDEEVDLHVVIQTAIRMTHSQLRYNTELRFELATKPMVIGNEGQLCQVFVNLILNAWHAMPVDRQRGNVIVIRLLELDSDSVVCVEIEDNGVGIPEKMHKRLFDPFYSTKEIGQGTGLGLYVCRNMVSAMGGRLELESTSGEGSVFRVFLNRISNEERLVM